jgi:hypothetical protein
VPGLFELRDGMSIRQNDFQPKPKKKSSYGSELNYYTLMLNTCTIQSLPLNLNIIYQYKL